MTFSFNDSNWKVLHCIILQLSSKYFNSYLFCFFRTSGDYLSLYHRGCSMLKCKLLTAQKMKFSIGDLVTFTEEILNGKFHFLCNGNKIFLDTSNYNNYEKSKYNVSKVTLRLVFVPRYVMFLIYLLFIYGPRY